MISRTIFFVVVTFFISIATVSGQSKGSFLLSAGLDLYKTDNSGFAEKTQTTIEGNYFFSPKFTGTLGAEFWSSRRTFFVIGTRFYPVDPIFIKFRALIGNDTDASLGMGYQRNLSGNFSLEGGMDYYFDPGELGIRVGLAYLF